MEKWYFVVLFSAFWIGIAINCGMCAIGEGLKKIANAIQNIRKEK